MLRTFLYILFFITSTAATGQDLVDIRALSGKTFLSSRLEYLKILNDTTLHSSINSYTDTALFILRNDTFYIRQRYLQTDQTGTRWIERFYDYALIKMAADSLVLKNNYRFDFKPDEWEDTLVFVNIELVKEPVKDFRFLKLDFSSPWSGIKTITIDSLGEITFSNTSNNSNHTTGLQRPKTSRLKGRLTQEEFVTFRSLLSKSLPSKLPLERNCPKDGAISNFEIHLGTKRIESKGCNLSWTQTYLLNYLLFLDHNKGFVRAKR